jgi:hypothetical protein
MNGAQPFSSMRGIPLSFPGDTSREPSFCPSESLIQGLPLFWRKCRYIPRLLSIAMGMAAMTAWRWAKKLMARGYRNVLVFEGGYPEWKDAGLPVEGENDEA